MQIFLSHASENADIAEKICRSLEENGTKCFIAPRDIRPGREYAEEIINGIDESAAVVLLMSREANRSPHVLREVEHAVSANIPILVYKLENVTLSKSMEYFLMTHQWVDSAPQENFADILAFAKELEEQGSVTPERVRNAAGKRIGLIAAAGAVLAAAAVIFFATWFAGKKDAPVPVQVGDTVRFGSYLDEDIRWRVLRISEDGEQAVLISSDILTMKAYDAAESGRYNYDGDVDYWSRESEADTDMALQARVRGNSDWSASNIRTWLNSDSEVVTYSDQPPMATAMAEKKNGYQNEAGFLCGFTKEEREAIVETEIVTNTNALTEPDTVTTYDRVYLLSLDELAWFDEAGMSKLASPTQAAVEQDGSCWYLLDYNEYGIEEFSWWLREPAAEAGSLCYLVDNGYTDRVVRLENAGLEGFGVRPAITVDLRRVVFRTEDASGKGAE